MRPDPRAFASVADEYERGRPAYPLALLDVLRPEGRVLDLAAGTGKLTRLLCAGGARVTAVEPLDELRKRIEADEVLDGTAEEIPLPDAAVDLVTVGDAWHWFDAARAAGEVARVTKPGGRVALVWQAPAEEDRPRWIRALGPLLEPFRGDHPGFTDDQGRGPLAAHPAFGPPAEHGVHFTWTPTHQEYLAYIGSASFVAGLPPDPRRTLLERVAAAVPRGDLTIPFTTRCWLFERV